MNRIKIIAVSIITAILQITLFSRIEIFGTSANISIPIIIALSIGFNAFTGSYTGLFIGLVEDLLFSPILGPKALFYFLTGFIVGDQNYRFNIKDIRTGIVLTFLLSLIMSIVSFVVANFNGVNIIFIDFVKSTLIFMILNTILYYPIQRIFAKIFVFPDIIFNRWLDERY